MRSLPKFVYKTEDSMEFQVELKWDTIPSGVRQLNAQLYGSLMSVC